MQPPPAAGNAGGGAAGGNAGGGPGRILDDESDGKNIKAGLRPKGKKKKNENFHLILGGKIS